MNPEHRLNLANPDPDPGAHHPVRPGDGNLSPGDLGGNYGEAMYTGMVASKTIAHMVWRHLVVDDDGTRYLDPGHRPDIEERQADQKDVLERFNSFGWLLERQADGDAWEALLTVHSELEPRLADRLSDAKNVLGAGRNLQATTPVEAQPHPKEVESHEPAADDLEMRVLLTDGTPTASALRSLTLTSMPPMKRPSATTPSVSTSPATTSPASDTSATGSKPCPAPSHAQSSPTSTPGSRTTFAGSTTTHATNSSPTPTTTARNQTA